jgi:hypothetical protein
VTQTFLSDYLGMMPLGFRHVKNFFELLFGSVFCGILSAAHFDKEVSKMSLFWE